MAPPSTSRSVSSGLAIALLAGCLLMGVLLGIATNANNVESRSLRNTGIQEQQQQQQEQRKLAGGLEMPPAPQMAGVDIANRKNEKQVVGDFVWDGNFAAVQKGMETIDLAAVFSFSYSYDY